MIYSIDLHQLRSQARVAPCRRVPLPAVSPAGRRATRGTMTAMPAAPLGTLLLYYTHTRTVIHGTPRPSTTHPLCSPSRARQLPAALVTHGEQNLIRVPWATGTPRSRTAPLLGLSTGSASRHQTRRRGHSHSAHIHNAQEGGCTNIKDTKGQGRPRKSTPGSSVGRKGGVSGWDAC